MDHNEKIEVMHEILQYIDVNIKNKLNVEKLAERAGFSPYYFCRGFKWVGGVSLMEYVRNRRLAYAAAELKSGRKIIDIAVEYGFETHSGFSKAFRRYFGCPPEIYRTYAVFNVPPIPDITKSSQFISGNILEPKIMAKKAAFKIAGYPIKVDPENRATLKKISLFREKYRNDGSLEKLHSEPFVRNHMEYGACFYTTVPPELTPLVKPHAEYGACFYKDNQKGESVYVIGVEVKPRYKIPFEYNVYTIPETLFAVFTTIAGNDGFSSSIEDTWQVIFSEWLPNSGYEFDDNGVAFELYDKRSTNDTEKVCDIYIPIVSIEL